MGVDQNGLKHFDLTEKIIGVFFAVYDELGHGFLESVYENAMRVALQEAGLSASAQVPIRVWFRGQVVGEFRSDLLVENTVLLELKATRTIDRANDAQLLNYLRATDIEVGMLMNFGIKPDFRRLVFENARKSLPSPI